MDIVEIDPEILNFDSFKIPDFKLNYFNDKINNIFLVKNNQPNRLSLNA